MNKYFIFIPNLLSIIRIALIYPILNNIYLGNFKISIIFFLVASLTDALDGFLARKMNWQTELGQIFGRDSLAFAGLRVSGGPGSPKLVQIIYEDIMRLDGFYTAAGCNDLPDRCIT